MCFLNSLRYLSNYLNVRIVAVGTLEADRLVKSDTQIGNRLESFQLYPWQPDDIEYVKFIQQLILATGLDLIEENQTDDFISLARHLSDGLTGETKDLLRTAARYAIDNGENHITTEMLEKIHWKRPDER